MNGEYAMNEPTITPETTDKRIEQLLLDGFNSGPMEEMTAEDWQDIRQQVRERVSRPRTQEQDLRRP
jgi:hypothetical protein